MGRPLHRRKMGAKSLLRRKEGAERRAGTRGEVGGGPSSRAWKPKRRSWIFTLRSEGGLGKG